MSESAPPQRTPLELWLSFARVVIVTGIFGAIGLIVPPWINAQIQSRELEIAREQKKTELEIAKNEKDAEIRRQRLQLEQNYVTTFLERATEENVENRYRFTRYLSSLTLDQELKSGWGQLFEDAKAERAEAQRRLAELEGQTDDAAKLEIAQLKQELASTKTQRNRVFIPSVPLSTIVDNGPCPEGSVARITANESLFSRSMKADEIMPRPSNTIGLQALLESVLSTADGIRLQLPRIYLIEKWCVDVENQPIGDVVLYGASGEIVDTVPVTSYGQTGLSQRSTTK